MAMKLSVELFNEIISSLKCDGTRSQGHEKRTQGRVGLRCALEIIPCLFSNRSTKPLSICVHDVSENGLGLVSPVKLDEELEFIARFTREGRPAVPVLYKVRHCRRLSADLYSVGAMFQRVLADSSGEIAQIGKSAKEALRKSQKASTAG